MCSMQASQRWTRGLQLAHILNDARRTGIEHHSPTGGGDFIEGPELV
jgi:hypothetical protein